MGYDFHITRNEKWFLKEPNNEITLADWKTYVQSNEELNLENFIEIASPNGEVIRFEADGISVWNNHPNSEKVLIVWRNGKISVKNPDDETIRKLIKIAEDLNAKVQGDEGETYKIDTNGKITST